MPSGHESFFLQRYFNNRMIINVHKFLTEIVLGGAKGRLRFGI